MNQDILRHLSIIYGELEDLHNQIDTLSRDNTTRRNRNRSNRSNSYRTTLNDYDDLLYNPYESTFYNDPYYNSYFDEPSYFPLSDLSHLNTDDLIRRSRELIRNRRNMLNTTSTTRPST